MSKQIKDISFTYHSVRGRHKIQLLTYSSNVQRARLKLNSHWKVSVSQKKKRELGNRHLMHVLTQLNTIDIQAHPTRASCGKPGGRQTVVESSLVVILINTYMNDNNKCNIGRKKKGETHQIGSALRQGEVRLLHHVTVSRQSSHSMTSCSQQITVPFAVCIFGGVTWRPSRRNQQASTTIRHNIEIFHVMRRNLMFR